MLMGNRFEPARFSIEELLFSLEHLEKPPIAALHHGAPKGVNPLAIENLLGRLYQLHELEKHENVKWAGYEQIREKITRFVQWHERSLEIKRRGGPRHPSQFIWDTDGRAIKYGIGADSSNMIKSEILDNGERADFGVDLLIPEGGMFADLSDVAPWLKNTGGDKAVKVIDKITEGKQGRHGTLTCSICGRAETFDVRSATDKNLSRARMTKHLRIAKEEISRHRMLYSKYTRS